MAKNEFKPFATANGANVTAQTDYEALPAREAGFQSGKASSAQINKAIRQATVIASVVAQFIANESGKDVLDDGNAAALQQSLLDALKQNAADNLPKASTTTAGIAKLSSATDSNDETVAATLKAVRVANDNANGRVPSGRKVNGKALTADITLGAGDVGAVNRTGDTMTGKLTLPQTSAFGINTANALGGHSIVLGDSNTGFKQNGDGVLDVYANNQHVFRFQNGVLLSNKSIDVTGNVTLKGDTRLHCIFADADGKARGYIWKDKGGDGIHINNGIDGGGDYIFHKDGGFRAPSSVYAGSARMDADGNIYGSKWGNQWLDVYLKNTYQPKGNYISAGQMYTKRESDARYVQNIQRGAVSAINTPESASTDAPKGCVMVGVALSSDGSTGTHVHLIRYCPLQIYINGAWRTIAG